MTLYKWSQTASADATADSTINWAEGQSPASVNDSARAMMAAIAKYRDDVAGAIVTTGTSTAYVVNTYQGFQSLSQLNGQLIAFTPHATNGATVTINIDSLGGKPLRSAPNVELPAGVLVQGTPYVALYNSSDAAFYLQSFFSNPYSIPIGASVDFWGATAPNSSFVLAYGQAISRTTYSTLFAMFSTTYGSGDGSTTFNVPDLRGRVVAGDDAMGGSAAGRITTAVSGVASRGDAGGAQSLTLVTANLPPYTPSVSMNTGSVTIGNTTDSVQGAGSTQVVKFLNGTGTGTTTALAVSGFSVSASPQGGTSTPLVNLPPMIVANKLLRVI